MPQRDRESWEEEEVEPDESDLGEEPLPEESSLHEESKEPFLPEGPVKPTRPSFTEVEQVGTILSAEEVSRGFVSSVPFEDTDASCLVVCCSDHRFRPQTIEFLHRLGHPHPYVISLPGGVAIVHSLAAAVGFLSKAALRLVDKAVELTGVTDIICIAHQDCGGYKAGRVKLIGQLSRRLAGKSIEEVQTEHLARAARVLRSSVHDRRVRVQAFYAVIQDEGQGKCIQFKPVRI